MRTKSPKRMEEIIDYVNQYTNHYRTSPSTREIAKAVKTDNGTVYRYLVEMNEKGMLEYNGKEIITPTIKKMETDMIQAAVLGLYLVDFPFWKKSISKAMYPYLQNFLIRAIILSLEPMEIP